MKLFHGSSHPLILVGDLKISDQNIWVGGGEPEQKIKFLGVGGANFFGGGALWAPTMPWLLC